MSDRVMRIFDAAAQAGPEVLRRQIAHTVVQVIEAQETLQEITGELRAWLAGDDAAGRAFLTGAMVALDHVAEHLKWSLERNHCEPT